MIARFFLKRPVFAFVISILLVLVGLVALKSLPIEQYPNITPPQVLVTATYPGASAKTLSDAVAAPLENQINGVEDMIYMYSQNASTGTLSMSIYFAIGTDPDIALSNVQDRVNLAMAQLPDAVQKQGIVVKKQTPTILLLIAVMADERYDEIYTNNYATIHIADELLRIPGVSNASVINARDYAMRVWLRPDKMAQLEVGTSDVVRAIQEQNADYPLGELGEPPTKLGVPLTLPMTSIGRLDTPKEFDDIILRANQEGASVTIKDIGHTELGAQSYGVNGAVNGKTAALIAVYQEYGANALAVADAVKQKLDKLEARFPSGLHYTVPYDTTKFIKISIKEVEKTLYEAAILVALVVFIFLQNWRATLVPVVAMIISIIGTFTGMHLLGFSLNTLTLFGLVLSIGIVVDDAIVVVENVERNMREKNLSPKEAALASMEEVSGPIIAIVCVLCAVFIPVAFLGGIAGGLYKQFAITIAISVVISGIVALTLSPILSALVLKEKKKESSLAKGFNKLLDKATDGYLSGARLLLKHTKLTWGVFIALLAVTTVLFTIIPKTLIPQEDQGYIFTFASLPEEASLEKTQQVTDKVAQIVEENPAVESFVSMTGFSLLDNLNRTPVGTYFIVLKDWNERKTEEQSVKGVIQSLRKEFHKVPQGGVLPLNPPAIQGLGTVGGLEFWIVNEGGLSSEGLQEIVAKFTKAGEKQSAVSFMSGNIEANCMQIYADVDRVKAKALGVSVGDVYQTLQALLGSVYVNNFNKYGHVFQVTVQAAEEFRSSLQEIGNIYVKSNKEVMVPLKSLVQFEYAKGPNLVSRFNSFPAARVNVGIAPGSGSMEVIEAVEKIAKEQLPNDVSYAWGGQAYQEIASGGSSTAALIGALVLVFLILAALYERWALPVAILLAVPFGTIGALLAIWFRGTANDVYFQIGLVTLIALAAKNAILIVEFAIERKKEGLSSTEAALAAAKQRFRAILMTSFTFILGVLPLVISSGAGAASRHSVGTGVMGGMLFATLFGIFFVPFFYVALEKTKDKS